jgi:hypothetical protein
MNEEEEIVEIDFLFSTEDEKKEELEQKFSQKEIERMKKNQEGVHIYSSKQIVPLQFLYSELKLPLPDFAEEIIKEQYGESFLKQSSDGHIGRQSVCDKSKFVKLESHFQHAGDSFAQEFNGSGVNFSA